MNMVTRTDGLLDILEIAMNTCCKRHKACEGCRNITACINLWTRACEQSFAMSLTSEQLYNYVEEFNRFLSRRNKDCQGSEDLGGVVQDLNLLMQKQSVKKNYRRPHI